MHDHRWLAAIVLAVSLVAGLSLLLGPSGQQGPSLRIVFWVGLVCSLLLLGLSRPNRS